MSEEVRPGYKWTEVGVIPEDWEVKPLGECAKFRTGPFGSALHSSDYTEDGVPVINPMHIINGNIEPTRTMTITEKAAKNLSDFRFKAGEIIIGRRGDMGRCSVIKTYQTGWLCGTGSMIIRCEKSADARFLQRLLSCPRAIAAIEGTSVGTTMINLNQGTLAGLRIQLPLLPEQRAIAKALSDVDALLGALDRLIAKKRDLKQAAMQQLLTGQTRLPGFHGEWQVKAIHEIAQVGRGRVISHAEISKSSSPLYPVFSSQTSNNGTMGYLDTYDFEGDYVTWTTDGANAGTVFSRSGKFNCTNVCGTIKLTNSNNRFIAAALGRVTQPHVSRHLGNPKLMNDVMKKIEISIPVAHTEQTIIAEVLSDMDAELAAIKPKPSNRA